jgi:hypothetical protein
MDIQQVLKALMPNISSTNDTMGLGDAQGFLSQLEGVLPGIVGVGGIAGQRTNISEELANITAIGKKSNIMAIGKISNITATGKIF